MSTIRETVTNHSYDGWTDEMRAEEEQFILAQEAAAAEYEQEQVELQARLEAERVEHDEQSI